MRIEKFEFSATDVRNAQKRRKNCNTEFAIDDAYDEYECDRNCMVRGKQVIAGGMKTGELFSFITYNTQILMSLLMFISMVLVMVVISQASADRIFAVYRKT